MISHTIVLGMHRSGTSLSAQILDKLGFHLGNPNEMLPANEGNPRGYMERADVVKANTDVLNSVDLDWRSVHRLSITSLPPPAVLTFRTATKEILQKMPDHRFIAIKNPLMSVVLPLWQPFLSDPIFLICVRHPLEVGQSLYARNNVPVAVGCALWEIYIRSALVLTQGSPRLVVPYDAFLSDPSKSIRRLLEFLHSHGRQPLPPDSELRAKGVIDGKLHRQQFHHLPVDDRSAATAEQLDFYEDLRNGIVSTMSESIVHSKLSTTLLDEFLTARRLKRKLKLERRTRELQMLVSTNTELDRMEPDDRLKQHTPVNASLAESTTIHDTPHLASRRGEEESSKVSGGIEHQLNLFERRIDALSSLSEGLREQFTDVEQERNQLRHEINLLKATFPDSKNVVSILSEVDRILGNPTGMKMPDYNKLRIHLVSIRKLSAL